VFGKQKGGAPVADAKVGFTKGAFRAFLEGLFDFEIFSLARLIMILYYLSAL
jgi:hypothetical protein